MYAHLFTGCDFMDCWRKGPQYTNNQHYSLFNRLL